MLVARRLAGLSALDTYYDRVGERPQFCQRGPPLTASARSLSKYSLFWPKVSIYSSRIDFVTPIYCLRRSNLAFLGQAPRGDPKGEAAIPRPTERLLLIRELDVSLLPFAQC